MQLDLITGTLRNRVPRQLVAVHDALSTSEAADMIIMGWKKCGFEEGVLVYISKFY